MSKVLDWSKIANVNFDDNRRKKLGIPTFKEQMQKALVKNQEQEEYQEWLKKSIPVLKNALLKAMVDRKPIKVLHPIQNFTESLPGLNKSEDEDDGFYQNVGPKPHERGPGSFEVVSQMIPAGIELQFKVLEKSLGQFLFQGSDGKEYSIYSQENIALGPNNVVQNTGYFGLLLNTDIRHTIGE